MIYGLWHSAAGLSAQQARQAIVANNLANVDTPGFKADLLVLRERDVARRERGVPGGSPLPTHATLDGLSGGLGSGTQHIDLSQAALVHTAAPLDVAIEGAGFLTVQTDDGVRYTRNGRLALSADGTLVTASGGHAVLDVAGRPIRIDPSSAGPIRIDERGAVQQGATPVATLGLAEFADVAALEKSGRNLFTARGGPPIEATGRVVQGSYEASGAGAIESLVRMVEASRAYELNATMISLQDQTLGRAVNDVGRLA